MVAVLFKNIANEIERLPDCIIYGQVTAILGLLVEITGVETYLSIGDHCRIEARDGRRVVCEVVGFRDGRALVMPFGTLSGIGLGCRAEVGTANPVIFPDPSWLGRVVNAFGEPIDDKGPLPIGRQAYPIHNSPPPAHTRKRVARPTPDNCCATSDGTRLIAVGVRFGWDNDRLVPAGIPRLVMNR